MSEITGITIPPGVRLGAGSVTIANDKDAVCFALEAMAVVDAAAEAISTNEFEGIQGLLKRVASDVEGAMRASDVARGQICNELRAVQNLVRTVIEQSDASSLLYAAESLIDLTLASLENREEVQHA